jgi:hypothetical protein
MNMVRLFAIASAIVFSAALSASMAEAQTVPTKRSAAHAKKPPVQALPAAPVVQPQFVQPEVALIEQKCLRALDGTCTDPIAVEAVRLRAEIIPTVRLSYFGTPAGTIGGPYIPFERLFQDNALLFGLLTNTTVQACCTTRTK